MYQEISTVKQMFRSPFNHYRIARGLADLEAARTEAALERYQLWTAPKP